MIWYKSTTDNTGKQTIHPPQPDYDKIPRCSLCGGLTQFKHFFPEVLPLLKDDDLVPSFCSTVCARRYVAIKQGRL